MTMVWQNRIAGLGAFTSLSLVCLWFWRYKWNPEKQRRKGNQRMTLYTYPKYRSTRCIWLAAEIGIRNDIEMIRLDPQDPDRKKRETYRRNVHPHGTIPALVVEGAGTIIESGAICLYLADLHKQFGPTPDCQLEYYNWIMYTCGTLDEAMEHLFIQWYHTEPKDQDKNLLKRMTEKFTVFAEYFSKYMMGKQYICGDRFTAADCVLGYSIWWASTMREGCLIKEFPEITKYLGRLRRRVAFQQTFDL